MIKIRNIISLILSILILFSVVGCNKRSADNNSSYIEEIVVYEGYSESENEITDKNNNSNNTSSKKKTNNKNTDSASDNNTVSKNKENDDKPNSDINKGDESQKSNDTSSKINNSTTSKEPTSSTSDDNKNSSTTSGNPSDNTNTENDKNNEISSKKPNNTGSNDVKNNNTASKKTDSDNITNENTSSKKYDEISTSDNNSSINNSLDKPNKDENSSAKTDNSNNKNESESSSVDKSNSESEVDDINIDKTIPGQNALAITMYHFNISRTTNYDGTGHTRFEELEDIFYNGYCNNIILSGAGELEYEVLTDMLIKYNVSYWICPHAFFDSRYTTIEEYMKQFDYLEEVRKNKDLWDLFLGFHFDENIWRGQSNADFLAMTKALYEKFGKRNFPVFATGEFTGYEGNQNQINMDANNMQKVNPSALKYVTDVAFDSYSVDVREGYSNGSYINQLNSTYPNIIDGKSYYAEYTKILLDLFDHDVNVWYFPCAYRTYLWSGDYSNEFYCIAHLKYFAELLEKQEFQGGLCLYTYEQFSSNDISLKKRLVVNNKKTGEQILWPNETKWKHYSNVFKEITTKFRSTLARHAEFNIK